LWEIKKSSSRWEVYSDNTLHEKKEISQINNLTLHHKELKKEQNKPKVYRRREIRKIRAEINEIETRKH